MVAPWETLAVLIRVSGSIEKHSFRNDHAGFSSPRELVFFFGGVTRARERRGGWLSIAARRMRLMRVW